MIKTNDEKYLNTEVISDVEIRFSKNKPNSVKPKQKQLYYYSLNFFMIMWYT